MAWYLQRTIGQNLEFYKNYLLKKWGKNISRILENSRSSA